MARVAAKGTVACGLPFMIPEDFRVLFVGAESTGFTCPNGHTIYFREAPVPPPQTPYRLNGQASDRNGRNGRLGLGGAD